MIADKQCIFFDLDGVLVATRSLHSIAFREALSEVGIPLTEAEHQAVFNGLPTSRKISLLRNQYKIDREMELQIDRLKQRKTQLLIETNVKKDLDLIRDLSLLRSRKKLAVCSNARRETLDLVIDRMEIRSCFDLLLSQEEVNEPKPSPAIYLSALKYFEVQASQCLVVEDSPHGVLAAQNAGIDVIVVENPLQVKSQLTIWNQSSENSSLCSDL